MVTFWWLFPGSPLAGVSLTMGWEHRWLGESPECAAGHFSSTGCAACILTAWRGGEQGGMLKENQAFKAHVHLGGSGLCPTCRSLLMAGRHGCSAEISPT